MRNIVKEEHFSESRAFFFLIKYNEQKSGEL